MVSTNKKTLSHCWSPLNQLHTARELGVRDQREGRGLGKERQGRGGKPVQWSRLKTGFVWEQKAEKGRYMDEKKKYLKTLSLHFWICLCTWNTNHQVCPSFCVHYPVEAHKKEAREGTWHLKSREHQDTARCSKYVWKGLYSLQSAV